jgi:hypothetical protein
MADAFRDRKSLHYIVKSIGFSPLPHHIAVVFVGVRFTELWQPILEIRGRLPLRQKTLTTP